jgi:bacteriochlorophyll 4-vinyl reductase
MREAGIGRVLVASLHQGIADILPMRLAFYENWLHAEGLRDGTIGLAPLYAVLSFLRQEDDDAYAQITRRAGEYAAQWTVDSMSPIERTILKSAPVWLRGRLLLTLVKRLVRNSYSGSRAVAKARKDTVRVDVRSSIFCTVREPVAAPLCLYYAAATSRLLALFGLPARAEVTSCRGTGGTSCVVSVALLREPAAVADGVTP